MDTPPVIKVLTCLYDGNGRHMNFLCTVSLGRIVGQLSSPVGHYSAVFVVPRDMLDVK